MAITEDTLAIRNEIEKLANKGRKTGAKFIYLVKTPRGATECSIYGDKITRKTIPELNRFGINDMINTLFVDQLGFDVSVRSDPVYGTTAITLWYRK